VSTADYIAEHAADLERRWHVIRHHTEAQQ
jgi:hypothetical protein